MSNLNNKVLISFILICALFPGQAHVTDMLIYSTYQGLVNQGKSHHLALTSMANKLHHHKKALNLYFSTATREQSSLILYQVTVT